MKKIFFIFFTMFSLLTTTLTAKAEQYVLACKLKISAVNVKTDEIMRTYMIDRYFIIDTVLAGVYDANNLPLDVNKFTDSEIIFTKKAASFSDVVDTRITYNRQTHQMTLNEIYAYASQFDQRAQFVTKGEGTCQQIKIERKPLF